MLEGEVYAKEKRVREVCVNGTCAQKRGIRKRDLRKRGLSVCVVGKGGVHKYIPAVNGLLNMEEA